MVRSRSPLMSFHSTLTQTLLQGDVLSRMLLEVSLLHVRATLWPRLEGTLRKAGLEATPSWVV